jgi:hypothetical protein
VQGQAGIWTLPVLAGGVGNGGEGAGDRADQDRQQHGLGQELPGDVAAGGARLAVRPSWVKTSAKLVSESARWPRWRSGSAAASGKKPPVVGHSALYLGSDRTECGLV